MILRKANIDDKMYLFNWVNKFDSLSVKIENEKEISLFDHENWFYERLKDKNTYIWIIENKKNTPIGQIRFQKKKSNYYDVDIYILSEERKKGLATEALIEAIKVSKFPPLRAIIRKNNFSSYHFFSKNGFTLTSEDQFKWILIKE